MRSFVLLALVCAVSANVWGITKENQVAFLNTDDGPSAGLWTLVGEAYADHHMITLIQIGDIDSTNDIFYIIAINRTQGDVSLELVGLSLDTAQIVSETVLPFEFSFNYVNTPGVDVIAGTMDVLVYGLNHKTAMFEIYRVTPSASPAVLTLVASWADNGAFIQSVDSFDTTLNLLWIQLEMNNNLTNLAFDINTGKMVYNLTDPYGLQSLNYDSVKQQIIGLGAPQGDTTPVVGIANGQYTVLATLPTGYTMAGPDDAAFDIQDRLLYQYVNNGNTVQLIIVNIDSGAFTFLPYTDGVSTTPVTVCFST